MKCATCNKPTNEFLIRRIVLRKTFFRSDLQPETTPLCRDHFFQEFAPAFLDFTERVVIFHPELDGKGVSYLYGYLPLEEIRQRKMGIQAIEAALDLIEPACRLCGAPAHVAYFDRGMLPRERVGAARWDAPQLDQVTALPDSLCRACALRAIVPALRRHPEFSNGLGCPYNGEGVFVTLQL